MIVHCVIGRGWFGDYDQGNRCGHPKILAPTRWLQENRWTGQGRPCYKHSVLSGRSEDHRPVCVSLKMTLLDIWDPRRCCASCLFNSGNVIKYDMLKGEENRRENRTAQSDTNYTSPGVSCEFMKPWILRAVIKCCWQNSGDLPSKMVHAGGRPFASLIDDNFDIDVEIAQDLEVYFAWAPPLSTEPRDAYELLAGQESISPNNVASELTALMELETKEYESFDEVRVLEGND
ncbi:hypothetical protein BD769DRAFT_1638273 [Suillus cothurnatus]|nr:hypothetical protein BD769DRAFT_1638273 [Suillus cothurnatus]